MNKIHKHIIIVSSLVVGLSSMSRESRDAIKRSLTKKYSNVDIFLVNKARDLNILLAMKPDLVFLGMKYIPNYDNNDKIWLSEFLDNNGVAYTGSGRVAHELELDKPSAKQRALDVGLDTSPFWVERIHGPNLVKQHIYPLFIKPTNRGGGQGVDQFSVVNSYIDFKRKVTSIAVDYLSDSLVEEYLPGREFSVAILKDELLGYKVMSIELVANPNSSGVRMLGSAVKSANSEVVSVVGDAKINKRVSELALAMFKALEARDYGRIDIRLNKDGIPQFLEANFIPSLIENYGSFPKACLLNEGIGYDEMLLKIVNLALDRKTIKQSILA